MTTVAYYHVSAAAFGEAIIMAWPLLGLDVSALASAWLEAPDTPGGLRLRHGDLSLGEAQLFRDWPEGRVFHEAGELRWERLPDGAYHLVLLSEVAMPPAEYQGLLTIQQEGKDEGVLLWGERKAGKWEEGRIPRLDYPPTWTNNRARLWVRYYRAEPSKLRPYESQFARYVRFEPFDLGGSV